MKLRKAIALLCAAVMLTACSEENSNANVQEGDSSAAERKSVSELFEGCGELQGKDFDNFRMPDKIEKPDYKKLYRFPDRRGGADIPDEKAKTVELLNNCFGDRFDEALMTCQENWDGSSLYSFYLPDGSGAAVLHGFPVSIVKFAGTVLTPDFEMLGSFSAADADKTVELKDGSCTVGELLAGMQKRLEKEILPNAGGFELVPLRIYNRKNSEGLCYADIEYGAEYQGIMLEDYSPMFIEQMRNGYEVTTSYSAASITLTVLEKDDYAILSSTFSEQYPLTEELTEAITLEGAVTILKNELAEYSKFSFDSVELKYCCKVTAPVLTGTDKAEDSRILADYGEVGTAYFEPTWCFFYIASDANEGHREAVKVNAVTGEITIDKEQGS